jgi:serine acetyltransferase
VIITPRDKSLRIGRGARIGAGTVITQDVPPGATVVSQPPRVSPRAAGDGGSPDGD